MKIERAASDARAPKALLSHIRKEFGTVPAFCEATGLDRLKVQKAIRGEYERMDVDFAFACQKATRGAVKAEWWTVHKGAA